MRWPLPALLSATTILCVVSLVAGEAPRNVSFDDQDSRITYSPSRSSWTLTEPGDWDAGDGRAHMLSDNPEAKASFKFTGVALHYWAARWPYLVYTTLTIDGLDTQINLTDPDPTPGVPGLPPSKKSSIVFSATDLENKEHDVTISVGRGPQGNYAIVDYFTITELGQASSATTTSGTSSTPASSSTDADASPTATDGTQTGASSKGLSTAMKISIAVAIIGVFALLLVLFFLLRWLKKRKQQQQQQSEKTMLASYPDPDRSVNSSLMLQQARSPASPTSPMWNEPMQVPAAPYQQYVGSRSSVRLVVPEDDPQRYSDGSDWPTTPALTPPPLEQPIYIPHHPYASSQPYTSSYGDTR